MSIPRKVRINGNSIHRKSTAFGTQNPLQLLDLTPYLMRYPFNKAIRLHIPQVKEKPQHGRRKKVQITQFSYESKKFTFKRSSLSDRRESRVPTRRSGILNCKIEEKNDHNLIKYLES